MAWYPNAIRKEIPPGSNDPRIVPIGVILHVRAGEGDSLYNYFNGPSGGIESHGYIRYDGTSEQYRDTAYEADANHNGNSFVRGGVRYGFISIETEGFGHGKWTPEQIAEIKSWITWAVDEHEHIKLRVCPAWDQAGIGYHVQFGAPGPWTPVAKECPGPERIDQFNNDIVPWIESGGQEDELTPEQAKQLKFIYERAQYLDAPIAAKTNHIIRVVERTNRRFSEIVESTSGGMTFASRLAHTPNLVKRAIAQLQVLTDVLVRSGQVKQADIDSALQAASAAIASEPVGADEEPPADDASPAGDR